MSDEPMPEPLVLRDGTWVTIEEPNGESITVRAKNVIYQPTTGEVKFLVQRDDEKP